MGVSRNGGLPPRLDDLVLIRTRQERKKPVAAAIGPDAPHALTGRADERSRPHGRFQGSVRVRMSTRAEPCRRRTCQKPRLKTIKKTRKTNTTVRSKPPPPN